MKPDIRWNNNSYNKNGKVRGRFFTEQLHASYPKTDPAKDDRENRTRIKMEIEERCNNGETLDVVVAEIANREDVKMQFDYLTKSGIADLATIFKNWYESYARNKDRNNKLRGTR